MELSGPSPAVRAVRTAALIILVAVAVFLPVDFRYFAGPGAFPVLIVYGLHAAIGIGVLLANHTSAGARAADGLAVVLVAGALLNSFLYLYLWPRDPLLIAAALI